MKVVVNLPLTLVHLYQMAPKKLFKPIVSSKTVEYVSAQTSRTRGYRTVDVKLTAPKQRQKPHNSVNDMHAWPTENKPPEGGNGSGKGPKVHRIFIYRKGQETLINCSLRLAISKTIFRTAQIIFAEFMLRRPQQNPDYVSPAKLKAF